MFRITLAVALLCLPTLSRAETCIASHYGVGAATAAEQF